ncbi:MAG: transcription termination factor Rho [Planctomycetota bacterium]
MSDSGSSTLQGVLHVPNDRADGSLREPDALLRTLRLPDTGKSPVVPRRLIDEHRLRPGNLLTLSLRQNGKVKDVELVEDMKPDLWQQITPIYETVALDPGPQIRLEHDPKEVTSRIIDLIAPIGFGQRGLIVAPPRTGKTVLMQNLAKGIHANNPQADLYLLLVDERPEEVTDMRRNVPGTVIASSNDNDTRQHIDLCSLASDRFKRLAETGRDVIVLMDSLTRLGRAFNRGTNSGKLMSGGIDARALEIPKKIFGAARKIEGGGSLTIIATALVQTNSRMDDVIFEEFKGTGNMEITLDRKAANDRVFPAIWLANSATRKEENLIAPHHMPAIINIRKHLAAMPPIPALKTLIQAVGQHPTNESFLKAMTPAAAQERVKRRAVGR